MLEGSPFLFIHQVGHVGREIDVEDPPFAFPAGTPQFSEDLVADGVTGLDISRSFSPRHVPTAKGRDMSR